MVVKALSIFHIPPNGVEVTDAEVISMRNASGADPHAGHAVVVASAIQGVNLTAATTAFADNGDQVTVKSNSPSHTETATVNVAAGVVTDITLPADAGLLDDGETLTVRNTGGFKSIGAPVFVSAGIVVYATLPATWTLVSAGEGVTVQNSANTKTAAGTMAVSGGNLGNVALGATDALLSDGDTIQIENQGETQGVGGTVEVAAGVAKAKLPASSALVANNVAMTVPVTGTYVDTITPTVTAAGVITGFVLS